MFGCHISEFLARGRIPLNLCCGWLTVAGIALLLAAPSGGAQSGGIQGVVGEVGTQVSWGSAGGCIQNIQPDNFGALGPTGGSFQMGVFDATPHVSSSIDSRGEHVWVGCVTTNTELGSVTAGGVRDMASAGHTLALADVDIGLTNSTGGELDGGQANCVVQGGQQSAGACPLPVGGTQPTLLTGASAGTTELDWQYQLNLPPNQPVGAYAGGEVIFTATAGDPSAIGHDPRDRCDVTWTGIAGDGRWETPSNWQNGSSPGPADHVCIRANTIVTVNAGDDQAGWITGEGMLELTPRSLLSVNGPSPSSLNGLTVEGGTLTGSGEIDVTGSFVGGDYGWFTGSGCTVIEPTASGTITPGSWITFEGRQLRNAGRLEIPTSSGLGGQGHADLINDGTLVVNGETGSQNHGLVANRNEASLTNIGTLEKTEGSGRTQVGFAIDNEGVVRADSGGLEFTGGGSSSLTTPGSWSATSSTASIVFSASSSTPFSLGAAVPISGSIEVTEGSVSASMIEGGNASLTVRGHGLLTVTNASQPSTVANLIVEGGTLSGAAEIDVSTSFTGGAYGWLSGPGSTVIEPTATGTITPGSWVTLEGRAVSTAGTLTVPSASGIIGQRNARLANSGTLIVNGESAGEDHGLIASRGEALLTNAGTLEKTEGSGPTRVGFAIDNEATVTVETGQLEFTGGGNSGQRGTDTWTADPRASIAFSEFSRVDYSLGATAMLTGAVTIRSSVTAGVIEGVHADLSSQVGNLTLTARSPSTLNSLTLIPPEPGFGNEQKISVAGELDIDSSLTWSSNTAWLEGEGNVILKPGSTNTFNPPNWTELHAGQLINEGTLTWASGGIDAIGDTGTFLINRGTFQADQDATNPVFYGCERAADQGYECPVLENTGTLTAVFPSGHPHIEWRVDIANYGSLEVPYEQEPECKPEFSETPGPGAEACNAAIREYEGLLLQDGAEVFEEGFCPQRETEPCIDDEPPEAEEEGVQAAPVTEVGYPISDSEDCKRSESEGNHCYALVRTPFVKSPGGFRGSSVEIDPVCLSSNGDKSNFADAEQWVEFPEEGDGCQGRLRFDPVAPVEI